MKISELGKVLFLVLIIVLSTTMISASDFFNNNENETPFYNIDVEEDIVEEMLTEEAIINDIIEEPTEVVEEIQKEVTIEEVIEKPIAENIVIMAANDSYEPDNNAANATLIPTNGTNQSHTISFAGDEDWFKFNAEEGYIYTIETYADLPYDTNLTLYFPDGSTLLDYNDDNPLSSTWASKIVWKAGTTETYYFHVEEYDPSENNTYYIVNVRKELINLSFITPTSDINVNKSNLFNVSLNVTCLGTSCTNLPVYLDPKTEKEAKTINENNKNLLNMDLDKKEYDVIIKLKDDEKLNKKINSILGSGSKRKSISDSQITIDLIKNSNRGKHDKVIEDLGSDFKLERKNLITNSISGKITKKGIEKLENNPIVDSVQEEEVYTLFLSSSVPHIEAESAWNFQYLGENITGKDQTVCVIDSGINYAHNDFGGCSPTSDINDRSCPKVIGGYNFINSNSNPNDDNGHGTHVAGTIASIDPTYRGVAYEANIVALKACNSTGTCFGPEIESSIDWCINNSAALNISVISMSLGGGDPYHEYCNSTALQKATNLAGSLGITVVVASGNEYYNNGVASPACAKYAIGVGAANDADVIASFSNQGMLTDIMAPGVSITSAWIGSATARSTIQGTSMATPHVSGAAALLNQYYKLRDGQNLNGKEIENILTKYSDDIYDSDNNKYYPRLNITKAINAPKYIDVIPETSGSPFYTTSNNPQLVTLAEGESTTLTWTINATGDYDDYLFFAFTGSQNLEFDYYESDKKTISIVNGAPSVSNVTISPELAYSNTTLTCTGTYFDINSDAENGSVINWYKNGILVLGNNDSYNGVKSGSDNITCEYIPSDGIDNGTSVNTTITISDRIYFNSTPITYGVINVLYTYDSNAVDPEGENINYSLVGNPPGMSINRTTGLIEWTPSTAGFYNITILANNTKQTNQSYTLEIDTDSDNDGLGDKEDSLEGNSSDITLNGISSIVVYVDNSTNLSTISNTSGLLTVEIKEGSQVIISFTFNFSSGEDLNLSNILINRSSNSSESRFITTGFPSNIGKTIYINNTLINASSVCIEDLSNPDLSNGSLNCGSGETQVNVNTTRTYTVTDLGDMWSISTLSHSAVKQVTSTYTAPSTPSGGGGGGGGGGSSNEEEVIEECTESWMCNPWESCIDNLQTRFCVDVNACGTEDNRPEEIQSCKIVEEDIVTNNEEVERQSPNVEKAVPTEVVEEPELRTSSPFWQFISSKYKEITFTLIFITLSVILAIIKFKDQ